MIRKLCLRRAAVLLAFFCVGAGQVRADDVYLSFFGGINLIGSEPLAYMDAGPPAFGFLEDGSVEYQTGLAVGTAVGYEVDLGSGFALYGEGELSYRHNEIKYYSGIDENGAVEEGDDFGYSRVLAFMANLGVSAEVFEGVFVHAAGGVGAARWSYGYSGTTADALAYKGDTQWGLAWQGIGGLGFEVAPGFQVGLEYRYFATQKQSFVHIYNGTPLQDDTDYSSHAFFVTGRVEMSPLLRAFGM